jgi:uncharacterized membrane protein YoaK (UPF0700 family)
MSIESLRRRFRNQCEGSNRTLVCFTATLAGATTAAILWTVKQYAWPIAAATVDSSSASRSQHFMPAVIAVILISYIAGAVSASTIVCFGEPDKPQRGRPFPLLLGAFILFACGLLLSHIANHNTIALLIVSILFSFLLALQSATIRLLMSEERGGAHGGGVVTDLGIELGGLIYGVPKGSNGDGGVLTSDRTRLRLLGSIVGLFLAGMLGGILGFNEFGLAFFLFLAAALFMISTALLMPK